MLKSFGLPAVLYVSAAHVGRRSVWDAQAGDELPLLSWSALRVLANDGVTVGAHGLTHQALTSMSPADIAFEAAQSRRLLEAGLDRDVHHASYPCGAVDDVVEVLFGGCGYQSGVTCERRGSTLYDRELRLPRLLVTSEDGPSDLVSTLRSATQRP